MVSEYVPDVGHIVWISLDPQRGREQSGRRPFLVLSRRSYNDKTSLAVGVPITSKRKGYPFEVPLRTTMKIDGVAIVDHVKSLDWRVRVAEYADQTSPASLRSVRKLLATFLDLT